MNDEHKDILLTQRVKLVDNINVRGGLYTQLLAKKVLTRRQIQNIKSVRTVSEQTEELLDELEQSGSKAFDLFCEALKADHQQEIVDMCLKPPAESKQNETTSEASQETKPSVSGSVAPYTDTHSANSPCSPGFSNVVSDYTAGQRVVPGVALREEFQHQTYRRSIDSSQLALHKPNLPTGTSLEHDAYYFYQNSIARPNLVPTDVHSHLKESGYLLSEKEQSLSCPSEKSTGFISKEMPVQMMGHSMMPNNNIPSYHAFNAHLPNVFNISSSSSSPMSTLSSRSPLKGLNPFAFQTVDSIHASPVQHKPEISLSDHLPQRNNTNIDSNYLNQNSTVLNSDNTVRPSSTQASITSLGNQRSCLEMPRYIELNNPASSHREMMALPHHIETSQTGLQQTDRNVPRLIKNDSVDTMHKRSISESEERFAKRSKEDPDCIQPDQVAIVTRVDPRQDRLLKVQIIGESQKQPSMPSVVIETDSHQEMYQKGVLQGVMDDPEIDLTDGPIDVKVEHCTRQFYLANFKQSYSMRRIPRGKALILNVNEVTGKPPRRGTDIDRENLHNLLCQLHFDVTVYNDADGLTAKEMVLKLQDFSQDVSHRTGESAIVCILSHGEEGFIFGSDGKKFELEGAFSLFDNTSCPLLRGKPKIFIVQACRGGALDRGIQYYTDEHDGSDARLRQCPSMSDMLICYPTQNGYYAWRNRDRGSWYVEALVQVFMKYAKCEDVCTMLNRVNLLVSKKVSNCPQIEMDQMSQMSEYKSTLRMPHLFFFPGIGTLM